MPSRSEGWGGLFKDEQYRLIRSASQKSIRYALREGTPPDSGGGMVHSVPKRSNGSPARDSLHYLWRAKLGFVKSLDFFDVILCGLFRSSIVSDKAVVPFYSSETPN